MFRRAGTRSDFQNSAGEKSHHFPQKSIRMKTETKKILVSAKKMIGWLKHLCIVHQTNASHDVGTGCLESFKIMLPANFIQALLNELLIHRGIVVKSVTKMKRVKNSISIDA